MIAKIIEIEKIPVQIYGRHKKWQKERVKAVRNPEELDEKYRKHPDINKLINNETKNL